MLPTNDETDWTDGELDPAPLNPQSPEYRAFDKFVELTVRIRQLKEELDQAEEQLEAVRFPLRNYMLASDGGFKSVVARGHTVYLQRQLFASKYKHVSGEQVCATLKANDLGQFVYETYHSKKISSHILELERAHKEDFDSGRYTHIRELLPPAVSEVLNVDPIWQVIARRR